MNLLHSYFKSSYAQKILKKKPGEEGFSLVELVVVIAVLSVLSAVAIPAFQGVQERAKTSAVKNGLTNGVKECIVSDGLDEGDDFEISQAYQGNYTDYRIIEYEAAENPEKCYSAEAIPVDDDGLLDRASGLPYFTIDYDKQSGVVTKTCGWSTIGCDSRADPPW